MIMFIFLFIAVFYFLYWGGAYYWLKARGEEKAVYALIPFYQIYFIMKHLKVEDNISLAILAAFVLVPFLKVNWLNIVLLFAFHYYILMRLKQDSNIVAILFALPVTPLALGFFWYLYHLETSSSTKTAKKA